MTHYEILGVAVDATPEQLNRAFRKRARECHPDHHPGKEDEYKAVSQAYEILADVDRRTHYDRTGNADMPDITGEATAALAAVFFELLSAIEAAGQNPEKRDLVAELKAGISLSIKRHKEAIVEAAKHIKQAKAVAARFVVKNKPGADINDNILAGMALSGVRAAEEAVAKAQHYLAVLEHALTMLKDFVYNFDKTPEGRTINEMRMFTMGPTSSGTSSGW